MPFDGLVVSAVVKELSDKLIPGRIEKVYQPENDEILFIVRSNNTNYKLLISADSNHARINLTNFNKQNPQVPPMFCMLLRKHLQGGKLIGIYQKDFDRIITIEIESYDELGDLASKQLIIEIMGRHSNIVLVDKKTNKIIDCIKRVSGEINRHREVLPGKHYILPPEQGKVSPLTLSLDNFKFLLKNYYNPISIEKSIYSLLQGISPVAARELCYRSKIDCDMAITRLTDQQIQALHECLMVMLEAQHAGCKPLLFQSKGSTEIIDFYAIDLYSYSAIAEKVRFESISEVIEKYYYKKDLFDRLKQKSIDLNKFAVNYLDKLLNKKQKFFDELLNASKAKEYRIWGELLTANLHRIESGMKEVEVDNYYDKLNGRIKISLDQRLSPSKNAQHYFKKYAKSKKAFVEINKQLEELEEERVYFENIIQSIKNSTTVEDIEEIRQELISQGYLQKRKPPSTGNKKVERKPLTFISSDGLQIMVGKNNTQNDILTMKTASKSDLWFHTKDIPGSHVILITSNDFAPETSILEAAELAAYFSKGRMSSNVPVDYTTVKNVKKTKGAKPGMVIYENFKTIYITPKQNIVERLEHK